MHPIKKSILSIIFISIGLFGYSQSTNKDRVEYIETHIHIQATYIEQGKMKHDWIGTAEFAIKEMDKLGISKCLIMPPPQCSHNKNPYDYKVLLPIIKKYPNKFNFIGGGGTLNAIIQQSIEDDTLTNEMKTKFNLSAQEIIDAGAVAFGEMTALHLSFNPAHPFESCPPNHPLFLELADISAKSGLPIDLHMEAITKDLVMPSWFKTPPNPKVLKENISDFEKLLEHNRKAKIIWQHVGWDNTGHLTLDLLDSLLSKHSNLYLGIKCLQQKQGNQSKSSSSPLNNGKLRKQWIDIMVKYPNRFVLGSDNFYVKPNTGKKMPDSSKESRLIVNQLPTVIQNKVAFENAIKIYKL